MKVGFIRCMQTEDMCPGTTDFKIAKLHKGCFADIPEDVEIEVMGIVSCGGCPGKRAVHRAKKMVKMGAEAIVFTSCISKGTPIGFPCPHYQMMIEAVRKAVGPDIPVYEFSH